MRAAKVLVLVLALSGCNDEELTGRDAVEAWSEVTCSRFVRCGWYNGTVEQCVADSVADLCTTLDCSKPYSESRWQDLNACLGPYEDLACEVAEPVCKL